MRITLALALAVPAGAARLTALAIAVSLPAGAPLFVKQSIDTIDPWRFIHRFCFKPNPSTANDVNPTEQPLGKLERYGE